MSVKAISTEYDGYLFRSRLEARWAVFFNKLGIRWVYEYEGLILSDGTYYLPDFYLPDFHCYFEVKGKHIKGTREEYEALRKIGDGAEDNEWAGLICFGDPMDDDLYVFCQETDDGGGGYYEGEVTIGIHPKTKEPYLFAEEDCRERIFFNYLGEEMEVIPMATNERKKYKIRDFVNKRVYQARKIARQARFEFGETPKIWRWGHA